MRVKKTSKSLKKKCGGKKGVGKKKSHQKVVKKKYNYYY